MPNLYAPLDILKANLGRTTTTDDATLLRLAEAVSRSLDGHLGRKFYSYTATRWFPGVDGAELVLPAWNGDLVAITALAVDDDGDETYGLSLVENTDYVVGPRDRDTYEPGRSLRLKYGAALTSWGLGADRVRITGRFGYSEQTESAGTLGAAVTDTTGGSITMTAGHGVKTGDVVLIGTEQRYVSVVSSNTLTATRAHNGTTAATALNGAAVSRRRYPEALEAACALEVGRLFVATRNGDSGTAGGPEFTGPVGSGGLSDAAKQLVWSLQAVDGWVG